MNEFFHMGGYAFYVWNSIGLFIIVMIIDIVGLKLKEKSVKRNIRSFLRRKRK